MRARNRIVTVFKENDYASPPVSGLVVGTGVVVGSVAGTGVVVGSVVGVGVVVGSVVGAGVVVGSVVGTGVVVGIVVGFGVTTASAGHLNRLGGTCCHSRPRRVAVGRRTFFPKKPM